MSGQWIVGDWKDLISWRPPLDLQMALFNRFDILYWAARQTDKTADPNWGYFHAIEDAWGLLNLDRYMIWVEVLPKDPTTGIQFTAEELLSHFRKNINNFLDTSNSAFYPYAPHRDSNSTVDEQRWLSPSPLGAALSIEIEVPGINETATVVCTHSEPRRWIFSTVKTPLDNNHPVSGNREFGFYRARRQGKSGYVFQTRGADRITSLGFQVPQDLTGAVFAGADELWRSLQTKFHAFVTNNGGVAEIISQPYSARLSWNVLRHSLFMPTVPRWHIEQFETAFF